MLLANTDRAHYHLPPLQMNARLMIAAQEKADDMATAGYFAHVSPTGMSPWYWFARAGYRYQFAGENLAVGFDDASSTEAAWMASATHRANILDPNYRDIGVAVSQGSYGGRKVLFVVEEFGSPLLSGP